MLFCQVFGVTKAKATNSRGGIGPTQTSLVKGLGYVWKSISTLNGWNSRKKLFEKLSSKENILEFQRSQEMLNVRMKMFSPKPGRPLKPTKLTLSQQQEEEWVIDGIEMDVGQLANILPGSPHFKPGYSPFSGTKSSSFESKLNKHDSDENLAQLWNEYTAQSTATGFEKDNLMLDDLWDWENESSSKLSTGAGESDCQHVSYN